MSKSCNAAMIIISIMHMKIPHLILVKHVIKALKLMQVLLILPLSIIIIIGKVKQAIFPWD